MKAPDIYIGRKRLELSKRLGSGGEGDVYLTCDENHAAKIYKSALAPSREAKVRAMVRLGLAETSTLVAFPQEVLTHRSGQFAGFTMRVVNGFRPVHELYGPKSRKIHYPKADYRFLVRAATNTARAVGQVHSSPCVIGDLNHSGILVAQDATVALIDADSFQVTLDGTVYPCVVGVPDFTAPELHGRSLEGVLRSKNHDHFALAVAIFQLLFMGRHPYAGKQQGSDLGLDELIARNLFAYSRQRGVGVSPPGVVATLDDVPVEVADAFELAFGLDPDRRPTALRWTSVLQKLERSLSKCSADPAHFHPTVAKSCPWCRMERATGAMLFLSGLVGRAPDLAAIANFDVERAFAAIRSVAVPAASALTPSVYAGTVSVSEEAKRAKSNAFSNKVLAVLLAAAAIGMCFVEPKGILLWLFALVFPWWLYARSAVDVPTWRLRFSQADTKWQVGVADWRQSLGVERLSRLQSELGAAVQEYRDLGPEKSKELTRLKTQRENRQRDEFLDRFLIRHASIPGIGPSKKVTLASFGVESAADIKMSAILVIPGFGSATAAKLLDWRATKERGFVYKSAPSQADAAAEARVEREFAAKAATLAKRIAGGQAELTQLAASVKMSAERPSPALVALATARKQAEVDLTFLGIQKPPITFTARTAPTAPSARPTPRPQTPAAAQSTVLCPTCGSRMVRRMARRGSNAGRSFWGCSRYPRCRGTRN